MSEPLNILITGSYGQLGHELKRCLETMRAEIGEIPSEYESAKAEYIDYDSLDISDVHAVMKWFDEHKSSTGKSYDIVINCAAITNVDGCEQGEATAFKVNALGPRNLAMACSKNSTKFVHVSTDYVFPGTESSERKESDAVCPVSAYGRTKWAGEILALDACEQTFIVRTAWLYGYVGKNFVKTMLSLAKEHGKISVVNDQLGNPTSANDLAYEILKIALTQNYGTYHCTNNGTCSWFDFASKAVDLAGVECEKEALTSKEFKERFPNSADRPAFSSLKNEKLANTIGDEMRPWEDALNEYMKNLPELGANTPR